MIVYKLFIFVIVLESIIVSSSSKGKLISDVLLWTPSHRQARVGRQVRTYLQQLCSDTGCCMEDLPSVMDDKDKWYKRVREIHASGTP